MCTRATARPGHLGSFRHPEALAPLSASLAPARRRKGDGPSLASCACSTASAVHPSRLARAQLCAHSRLRMTELGQYERDALVVLRFRRAHQLAATADAACRVSGGEESQHRSVPPPLTPRASPPGP